MNLRMMYRYFLLSVCVVYSVRIYAQKSTYQYQAELNQVMQDGFYRVSVTPDVYGRCRPFLEDLRILDEKGAQIPYVFDYVKDEPLNIDFPIVREGRDADRQYAVVLSNVNELACERFDIKLKNTDAIRSLTFSGSDNGKDWFAIREDFYWDTYTGGGVTASGTLSVPATSYRFFKLTFNGINKLPLKVLAAGSTGFHKTKTPYLQVPSPAIIQKDSANHISYVTLRFPYPYYVDKLELDIRGPRYFHRSARFWTNGSSYLQSNLGHHAQPVSSGIQAIYLGGYKGTEITVEIDNDDNPPLKILGAKAYQHDETIVTYLAAGKHYTLAFGDSLAGKPVYDLAYFKDSIGKQIPELSIGKIEPVKAGATMIRSKPKDNRWLLWPVLVLVLAGLSFVTFKMVRKIGTET